MLIIPERQSHWYYPDGSTCHQVEAKSGNGLRNATLRDARDLGLVPSVTNILSIKAKPELENWKRVQAVMAALTLPRLENEPLDAFARRVVEDSEVQTNTAADFGRKIHKAVERWLLGSPAAEDGEMEPWLASFKAWAASEVLKVHAAEKVVTNPFLGYAGTLDVHCDLRGIGEAVVDIKSQGVKNGKPNFYKDWVAQLGAYVYAIDEVNPPTAVNIVIDSTAPGPIWCKQWSKAETAEGWAAFKSCLFIWCWQKEYYPGHAK